MTEVSPEEIARDLAVPDVMTEEAMIVVMTDSTLR